MSILEDHNKIREIAQEISIPAPEQAWDKIQNKIEQKAQFTKRKRLNFLKFWFSIAASTMVILTCATIIYFESQQPSKYSKGKVESWEELETDKNIIYSVSQARALDKLYNP